MEPLDFATCGGSFGFAAVLDPRGPSTLAHYLDFAPAVVPLPSGAHRFHLCFFGRKTRRIALKAAAAARLAVGDFTRCEDARPKPLPGKRTFERLLYAIDFNGVDARADNRHKSCG